MKKSKIFRAAVVILVLVNLFFSTMLLVQAIEKPMSDILLTGYIENLGPNGKWPLSRRHGSIKNGDLVQVQMTVELPPVGETRQNVAIENAFVNLEYLPGSAKFVPNRNTDIDSAKINEAADAKLQSFVPHGGFLVSVDLGPLGPGEGGTLYFDTKVAADSNDNIDICYISAASLNDEMATDFLYAELKSAPTGMAETIAYATYFLLMAVAIICAFVLLYFIGDSIGNAIGS